jgi:hypothetical protein
MFIVSKYSWGQTGYLSGGHNPRFNTLPGVIVAFHKEFYKHAIVHKIKG